MLLLEPVSLSPVSLIGRLFYWSQFIVEQNETNHS